MRAIREILFRMDSAAFVTELEQGLEQVLRRLTPEDALQAELDGDLTVENLLKVAFRNELEATEVAARWMATTPEVEVKLAFARQIGDEAKHYRPPPQQAKAWAAVNRMLELAQEMQNLYVRQGMRHAAGC